MWNAFRNRSENDGRSGLAICDVDPAHRPSKYRITLISYRPGIARSLVTATVAQREAGHATLWFNLASAKQRPGTSIGGLQSTLTLGCGAICPGTRALSSA